MRLEQPLALWVAIAVVLPFHSARETPTLDALLARAATHVHRLEREYRVIIADENYTQQRTILTSNIGAPPRTERRLIVSEVLFLWFDTERRWIAVRNVRAVDGKPIADSARRLDQVLNGGAEDTLARIRQLRNESARFNLGAPYRNFNDPTVALQLLDARYQHRFAFSLGSHETIAGDDVWKLPFVEHTHPTVIQNDDGRDLPVSGAVWANAADGVVSRTELALLVPHRAGAVTASIRVDFRLDQTLNLSMPHRMHEEYVTRTSEAIEKERIRCTATYANFRRFETAGRLVPPK